VHAPDRLAVAFNLAGSPPSADGLAWAVTIPDAGDQPGWTWQHYDLVNPSACRAIEGNHILPAFARALLLSTDEMPRIIEDEGIIAGVMSGYARTGDADEFTLVAWHFALDRRHLVTGRRSASRAIVHQWEALQRGITPAGPGDLVERCIVDFAREARVHLAALSATLDPIEDLLFEPRDASRFVHIGGKLGSVRREAAVLKRVLTPLVRTLDDEDEDLHEWSMLAEHDQSRRLVRSALDDIAALNDRARSLQDELTTRLAEETNRRLYIVSVVTTLVMPATFVTGFFGMNTGGLLWAGDGANHGTLFAGLLCLGAVVVTLLLLRMKRLL
jgi:zinc transporter